MLPQNLDAVTLFVHKRCIVCALPLCGHCITHGMLMHFLLAAEAQDTLGSLQDIEAYFQAFVKALAAVGLPGGP